MKFLVETTSDVSEIYYIPRETVKRKEEERRGRAREKEKKIGGLK